MKTLLARWSRFPRVSAKTRGDTAPFVARSVLVPNRALCCCKETHIGTKVGL